MDIATNRPLEPKRSQICPDNISELEVSSLSSSLSITSFKFRREVPLPRPGPRKRLFLILVKLLPELFLNTINSSLLNLAVI